MKNEVIKVRIDKWLWAVRMFKTRSLATEACNAGKVKIDGDAVKPSKTVNTGEIISIRKDSMNFTVKVLELLEKRVSAKLVSQYMQDLTPEDEHLNQKLVQQSSFYRPRGLGRPTKKERRDIDKLKNI